MSDTFDLTQEAILGRLFIGQGSLYSRSDTLTREAAEKHEADKESVSGIVRKLKASDRAKITKAINEARALFYTYTLPWSNNAFRLIPLTKYVHLKSELQRLENDFMDAVEELLTNYDDLREDYHRRVRDLAQEVPFPTKTELRNSFRFSMEEMPIANSNDIRLRHINQQEVEELKQRVQQQISERLIEAEREIIQRLTSMVTRVKEQTASKDKRIFQSLIDNIDEAMAVLPALNIDNNPEITRLIERVNRELASVDVKAVRTDEKFRKQVHKQSSDLLTDLRSFGHGEPKPQPKSEPKAEPKAEPKPTDALKAAVIAKPVAAKPVAAVKSSVASDLKSFGVKR